MPCIASKRRVIAGSRDGRIDTPQVVATATATRYPNVFPPVPDSEGRMVFAGDMKGAKIAGARWDMSVLTTFTAADAKLQHSSDGVTWADVDGGIFANKTATGVEEIFFADDDAFNAARYWGVLIDMTGTPGTSSHLVELLYSQPKPKGHLAPPGRPVHG